MNVVRCTTLATEHGSDHRAFDTILETWVPDHPNGERLLLKNAPWKEINAKIAAKLENSTEAGSVQQKTDQLMAARKTLVDFRPHIATPRLHLLAQSS